jgi:hypothetical protein
MNLSDGKLVRIRKDIIAIHVWMLSLDIPTDRTCDSISQNLRCESVWYVCDCYGGLCVSMCQVYYLLLLCLCCHCLCFLKTNFVAAGVLCVILWKKNMFHPTFYKQPVHISLWVILWLDQ